MVNLKELSHGGRLHRVFIACRILVLILLLAILFNQELLKFIFSQTILIGTILASTIILAAALLYDLLTEQQTSVGGLINKYFFLTLSIILLFGLLFYFIANKIDPPGFYYTHGFDKERDIFYFSAVSYFTIGFGDITPAGVPAKSLSVIEAMGGNIINLIVLAMAFRRLDRDAKLEDDGEDSVFHKINKTRKLLHSKIAK